MSLKTLIKRASSTGSADTPTGPELTLEQIAERRRQIFARQAEIREELSRPPANPLDADPVRERGLVIENRELTVEFQDLAAAAQRHAEPLLRHWRSEVGAIETRRRTERDRLLAEMLTASDNLRRAASEFEQLPRLIDADRKAHEGRGDDIARQIGVSGFGPDIGEAPSIDVPLDMPLELVRKVQAAWDVVQFMWKRASS